MNIATIQRQFTILDSSARSTDKNNIVFLIIITYYHFTDP